MREFVTVASISPSSRVNIWIVMSRIAVSLIAFSGMIVTAAEVVPSRLAPSLSLSPAFVNACLCYLSSHFLKVLDDPIRKPP